MKENMIQYGVQCYRTVENYIILYLVLYKYLSKDCSWVILGWDTVSSQRPVQVQQISAHYCSVLVLVIASGIRPIRNLNFALCKTKTCAYLGSMYYYYSTLVQQYRKDSLGSAILPRIVRYNESYDTYSWAQTGIVVSTNYDSHYYYCRVLQTT